MKLIAFLLIALILGSCSGRERRASPGDAGEFTSAREAEPPRAPDSRREDEEKQTSESDRNTENQSTGTTGRAERSLPITRIDRLISIDSVVEAHGYDYKIGALFYDSLDGDSNAIVRAADEFFQSLRTGSVPVSVVHPDWIGHLNRSLSTPIKNGLIPSGVRYGVPIIQNSGAAQMDVRLYGDPGEAIGILFFALHGNKWLVTDIHADLSSLLEKPVTSSEEFDPTHGSGR